MERDYEDIDEIDEQTDGELRALVRDRLDEQVGFDPADVDVNVRSGTVILSGRVGTEEELRIVEHVVTDVVGIKAVTNDIFIDPIRRAKRCAKGFCWATGRATMTRKPSTSAKTCAPSCSEPPTRPRQARMDCPGILPTNRRPKD